MEFNTTLEKLLVEAAFDGGTVHICTSTAQGNAELWLDNGCIVAVKANGQDRRLGARLSVTGHLRDADLMAVQASAETKSIPLVQELAGQVRRDVLSSIVADEARFAVAAALAESDGSVSADQRPPTEPHLISLDLSSLLAECKAFIVDIQAAEATAPAHSRPAVIRQPGPSEGLNAEDWAVVDRCDGGRTVASIARTVGLPVAACSLIVSRLVGSGFLVCDIDAPEFLVDQDLEALSVEFATMSNELITLGRDEEEEEAEEVEQQLRAENPATEAAGAVAHTDPFPANKESARAEVADISPRADTQALLRELASLSREGSKS
ncbi:MAG: hypothetical protein NVSMB57_01420 [Actinomycetota bacterium]